MIFESGSVKFRCAVGFGANGSRPFAWLAWLLALRLELGAPRLLASAASASNATLASRIF